MKDADLAADQEAGIISVDMTGHELPAGLPDGRWVVPEQPLDGGAVFTEPVLWVSDAPVAGAGELWARLLAEAAGSGFWPLLLVGLHIPPSAPEGWVRKNAGRPWHAGELEPVPVEGIRDVDVSRVLAQWWRDAVLSPQDEEWGLDEQEQQRITTGNWPWPLSREGGGDDPDAVAAAIAASPEGTRALTSRQDPPFIGLVPAADGAAAIAASGWLSRAGDTTDTAAIIRSWQDRYGARLCVLGMDRLALTVAWPPQTLEEARQAAAEHLAFCHPFEGDFDEYTSELIGERVWRFWWD